MGLFWALILLGILVLAHELGHFLVAKATGVKVLAFSIGFGPRVVGFRFGETEYRISAIPLGGYVKLLGQESSENLPAGVLHLDPQGPAAKAGIKVGDIIVQVDDVETENWEMVQDAVLDSLDSPLKMAVERNGERLEFSLVRGDATAPSAPKEDRWGRGGGAQLHELGLTVGDHSVEKEHAFFTKPLWVRFAVVFAGPAASLIFPILIYFVYFLSVDSMPSAQVGQILAGSSAQQAGLQPGDRIAAIDGEETPFWDSMRDIISDSPNKTVTLTVERDGRELQLPITPEASTFTDQIGDQVTVGRIGITADTIPAIVGPTGPQTPAYQAGIRLGDTITAINGEKIQYIWQLENQLQEIETSGRTVQVELSRKQPEGEPQSLSVKLIPAPKTDGGGFTVGLASADTFIGKVDEDSPASQAGLQDGDWIVSIDGRPVSAWIAIEQVLRQKMDNPIEMVISRDGKDQTLTMAQKKEVVKSEFGDEITRYRFGAWSAVERKDWVRGEWLDIDNRLTFATSWAGKTMVEITTLELRIFAKLFQGEIPFKSLGGPIMIFDIAGKAAEQGWLPYLWIMAMISINLGILNLLPIPVLDGGHLMFFTIEAITRRPLNQRLKERAIMVGLAMLLMLMVLVFKNDVERYFF